LEYCERRLTKDFPGDIAFIPDIVSAPVPNEYADARAGGGTWGVRWIKGEPRD
jgi:hypothetical protein